MNRHQMFCLLSVMSLISLFFPTSKSPSSLTQFLSHSLLLLLEVKAIQYIKLLKIVSSKSCDFTGFSGAGWGMEGLIVTVGEELPHHYPHDGTM